MSSGWSFTNAPQRQEFGNWLAFAICNFQSQTTTKKPTKLTTIKRKTTRKIVSPTFASNTPLPKWLWAKSK